MVRLAPVFTDRMVLQRDKEIAIFGTAAKEAKVVITICETLEADGALETGSFAVKAGKWQAKLPAHSAGGPYVMKVTYEAIDNSERGQIVLEDVYYGEVWLAGGQSNMELELQNSLNGREVLSAIGENPADANIRFYYTPKIAYKGEELENALKESCWQEAGSESSACWSAVAFYFARKLAEKLNCKVGIIGCNWGGTSASCWISRETLKADEKLSHYIDRYDAVTATQDEQQYIKAYYDYLEFQKVFDEKVGEYYRTNPNPSWDEAETLFGKNQYPGPMGPRNFTRPSGLYETMLENLMPYTLKGFIYYQGEEDDNRPYGYKHLLAALVKEWRYKWGDDNLPFINVQLPIFLNEGDVTSEEIAEKKHEDISDGRHEDSSEEKSAATVKPWDNWPFIREAQYQLANELNDYYVAVILEAGERYNIHPLDKETVGYRLSLQAFENVYGITSEINANPPAYRAMQVADAIVYISFDNCADCAAPLVVCRDGDFVSAATRLQNQEENVVYEDALDFEVAGEDKIYYPVTSVVTGVQKINGQEVQLAVSSKNVKEPVYVRYFWKNYGIVKLYGANGIPVPPFRTSMFDGSKANWSRQGEIIQ